MWLLSAIDVVNVVVVIEGTVLIKGTLKCTIVLLKVPYK